jgi:hypothetical protein
MTMKRYALALCIGLVGLGLAGRDQASAFPIAGSAVEQAAAARSSITEAQFYGRRTRHGVVKCYRTLVIGRYRCHRY